MTNRTALQDGRSVWHVRDEARLPEYASLCGNRTELWTALADIDDPPDSLFKQRCLECWGRLP